MGRRWLAKVTITIILCVLYKTTRADLDDPTYVYPPELTFGDDTEDLDKRGHSFVRIGRGLSSFIRIGRDKLEPGLYESVGDDGNGFEGGLTDAIEGNDDDGLYTLPEGYPQKRISSFVRIGRGDGNDVGPEYSDFNKRGGAFMRVGKFPSPGFRRWRNRVQSIEKPYYRRTGRIGHSFIRIGKRDTSDAMRRMLETNENDHESGEGLSEQDFDNLKQYLGFVNNVGEEDDEHEIPMDEKDKRISSFVRIGRQPGDERYMEEGDGNEAAKRISSFVRIGRQLELSPDKRHNSFVRIGRRAPWDLPFGPEKRISSFVRIGKNALSYDDIKKRISSFVRIGKSGNALEKRPFVRIGKNLNSQADMYSDAEKRAHAFVRIGKSDQVSPLLDDNDNAKRAHAFVRIGKSTGELGDEYDKRAHAFVRIGKSTGEIGDGYDKRAHAFVRIGKSTGEIGNDYDKRAHAFVRIGKSDLEPFSDDIDGTDKRISSFVRIGKSMADDGMDKRISSFVRIGKRSDPAFNSNSKEIGPPGSGTQKIPVRESYITENNSEIKDNTNDVADSNVNFQHSQENSGENIVYLKTDESGDTGHSTITQ